MATDLTIRNALKFHPRKVASFSKFSGEHTPDLACLHALHTACNYISMHKDSPILLAVSAFYRPSCIL